MITPSFALTATERVLPRMAVDFTTAVTDSRVVTTRANNTATRFNSSGVIEIVNANLPRYDYDPVTLVCLGQLIEEARTNLLLNSLINGTNLSTQSVTLTAAAHTLSFYGSGSVAISGGHTATVTGTGNFPSRRTYTFTPTAGSSTFTVTGDVKYAQLELGSFATSFIPTAGASVQRAIDSVNMTGTNFSAWYNSTASSFYAKCYLPTRRNSACALGFLQGGSDYMELIFNSNTVVCQYNKTAASPGFASTSNTSSGIVSAVGAVVNTITKVAALGGSTVVVTNAGAALPSPTSLRIGRGISVGALNGHLQEIMYWPQTLTNNEVQAFSKS